MLVVFWLAQPRTQLAERLAHAERTDQLTLAYLRAWLAAKPNDWPLYLVLARHGQLAGELDEALAVVARAMASDDPSIVRQAGQMRFSLLRQKIAKLPEGSPERAALLAQLVADLEAAARNASATELMTIATEAQALGQMPLALRLWRQALGLKEAQNEAFYATLAANFLANGEHRLAADAYWRAFDVATTVPRRRALLMQAIRTLQASNRIGEALDEAEARLGQVTPDRELYELLVRLALAAGRLEQAEKFAREMLRFSLEQQLRRELAAQAPDAIPADLRIVRVAAPASRRRAPAPAAEPLLPALPASTTPRATETPDDADTGPQPRLPFDNTAYRLAYDVFLARGNLRDAYKVARSAVRQAPENLEWRRRLAEIAEWTGRPQLALDVWRSIVLRTGDPKAWAEVRRLALALNDQLVMLEVLQWEATRGAPDAAIDLEIAATLERLGEPRAALAWLQRRIDAGGAQADPRLIDALLGLTDRLDDPQARIDALRLAMSRGEPQPRLAARLARILMGRGDFKGAFEALATVAPTAADPARHTAEDEKKTLFWLLYAESARLLQREEDAIAGFRQRLVRNVHETNDLGRLASLLEPRSLAAALAVLEFMYRAEPGPELLRRIILMHLRAGNLERVQALLTGADPATRATLEEDGEFLRARGSMLQAAGRSAEARRDFERALSRRGGDLGSVEALMWLLLAQKDAPALRTMLARFEPVTRKDGQLDGVFGAVHLALNEPDSALKYLQRQARRREDYLWWLAYADGLSDAGQADLSWRVRRKVWTEVRDKLRDPKAVSPELRTRIVGLAAQFAPSDNALKALRAALTDANLLGAAAEAAARSESAQRRAAALPAARRTPVAPTTPAPAVPADGPELDIALGHALARQDPLAGEDTEAAEQQSTAEAFRSSVRELGLAWLLSAEVEESARAWLMSRYADELSQPAFARLSLALNSRDKSQLVQLLDDIPDWLPKLDRISALKATSQLGAAQELAFETLGSRPRSDDAHQRFVETLLDDTSSAQLNVGSSRIGPLDLRSQRLGTGLRLTPTIGLSLAFERNDYSIQDPAQIAYVPDQDRSLIAGARLSTESAQWRLALGRRSAIRDFTSARLEWERVFEIGFTVGASLGWRQPATELPTLRVGGHRDVVETRATYAFGPREYVGASLFGTRFHTQDGQAVAQGWVLNLEGGYRLRLDYPDVTLKAAFTSSNYGATGQPDAIVARLAPAGFAQPLDQWVPRGSTQASIGASIGDAVAQSYTRALRPFGEIGLRSNSVTGGGYNLRGGLSMSIFGSDRFSGFYGIVSRTPGNTRGTREVGLSYQWYY